MINNFTDEAVSNAVWRRQREIFKPEQAPENFEQFVYLVSRIATKATLDLLMTQNGETDLVEHTDFPLVFAEWAQQFTLKTHFDRFLVAAAYLREKEGLKAVSTAHVLTMYDKARWKRPANAADVFAKAAERIYFVEADEQSDEGLKLWSLTRTGYEHLMSLRIEE